MKPVWLFWIANMFNRIEKQYLWALAFLAPSIFGLLLFRLVPIIWSFGLSFTKWHIYDKPVFNGLNNYLDILNSPKSLQAFQVTAQFASIYVPGVVVLALGLAVLLNSSIKGAAFFRGAYFLPYITSTVAVSLVWRWMFSTRFGLLNYFLGFLGVRDGPAWLGDPNYALLAVAIVAIWKDSGFYMLLLLAGLQTIDPALHEAAAIDGARAWRRFIDITVPLLSRSLFFVIIIALIKSTHTFDIIQSLTGGGPNGATANLPYAIYHAAFVDFDMGRASTLSYLLCLILGIITLINFRLRKRWVYE